MAAAAAEAGGGVGRTHLVHVEERVARARDRDERAVVVVHKSQEARGRLGVRPHKGLPRGAVAQGKGVRDGNRAGAPRGARTCGTSAGRHAPLYPMCTPLRPTPAKAGMLERERPGTSVLLPARAPQL